MTFINTQGLEGLSVSDRQWWEKNKLSSIVNDYRNLNDEQKDRVYRNQKFYEAFGKRSNYDELKKMTPYERDAYYSKYMFDTTAGKNLTQNQLDALDAKGPTGRDDWYYQQYMLNKAKTLYGNSPDINNLLQDKKGNALLEPETMMELINSGIKPEAEVSAYEKTGALGHIYVNGQKRLADGSLSLLQGSDYADNSTASRVFGRAKKAVKGGVFGALEFFGDAFMDVLGGSIYQAGSIYDAIRTGDGKLLFSGDNAKKAQERLNPDFINRNFRKGTDTAGSLEREWLREANNDAIAEILQSDYQRKMEKGKETVDAYTEYFDRLAFTLEGVDQINKGLDAMLEAFPYYREFKDTKYLRNRTIREKTRMLAECVYMLDSLGPDAYATYANSNVQKLVSDAQNSWDRLCNGGFDLLAQVAGGIAGYVVGQESIGASVMDAFSDYDANAYHQGFMSDGTQIAAIFNPVYWEHVSPYGTFDWDEIKRIKYRVGSEDYRKFAEEQREATKNEISEQEIEDAYIQKQWDEGKFRGDQISRHVTVYDPTTENDAFSLRTLYGAVGMSGQVVSQALLAKGVRGAGSFSRMARQYLTPKRYAANPNKFSKLGAAAEIALPTIPIAQSYAQGAYEKTILANREKLDAYLNNYVKTDEGQTELQRFINEEDINSTTARKQRALKVLVNTHPEYANNINGDALMQTPEFREIYNALATEDFLENQRSEYYGHLDEGALTAFWTSFGLETLQYAGFNMFNRQFIYGDASRTLRGVKPDFKVGYNGASAAVEGTWNKALDVAKNVGKEFWNSGRTNYCDELFTAFSVGVGSNLPTDYMGRINKTDKEFMGFSGAILNGFNNMADVADDASSIQAFTTGALGFLVGGNTINTATAWITPTTAQYSDAEKIERIKQGLSTEMSKEEARELFKQKLGLTKNDYSTGRHALEWITYLTGNSALLNVSQRLQQIDDGTRIAHFINAQLSKDEEALSKNKLIGQIGALTAAREAAGVSGNSMSFKDANYMNVFHSLRTLSDMREMGLENTRVYQGTLQAIQELSEGNITEDDVASFLGNPENVAYTQTITDEQAKADYARERIQKNAEKFLEVNESFQRNKEVVDKTIGDLSKSKDSDAQDFYYDLLFKMSWSDDAKQRLESMEKQISGSSTTSEFETPYIQHLIATVGENQAFVQGLADNTKAHIKELQNKIKTKEGVISLMSKRKNVKAESLAKHQQELTKSKQELARFEKLLANFNDKLSSYETAATYGDFQGNDIPVYSDTQILSMNPEERLFMLTHAENFAQNQQTQIEKARAQLLKTIGNGYLETLRDSHLLQRRIAMNNAYITNTLGGNYQEAIQAIADHKTTEAINLIEWLGMEKLKSLTPIIKNKVTKKLVSTIVGMPTDDLGYAKIVIKDPNKLKVLNDAFRVAQNIQVVDQAIEMAGLSRADKSRVTDIFFKQFVNNLESEEDMNFLDEVVAAGEGLSDSDFAIYSKVVDKVMELLKQKFSTIKAENQEAIVEEPKNTEPVAEEATKVSDSVGENTKTPEQILEESPQTMDETKIPVQTVEQETLPINTQGTSMQGNWINGYDIAALKKTGVQIAKTGSTEGDTYNRWLDWTAQNGILYQNVVDFELARIIEKTPNIPVHMLMVNPKNNATHDNLIGDSIMLAIEATDAVKRIHNDEYGHYVMANGKEYLIIGRAGVEKAATDEQRKVYDRTYADIKAEASTHFTNNNSDRFYVSDKYSTEVRYIQNGFVTNTLVGEATEGLYNIAEMLKDPTRDPYHINSLDNLGWYIQVGDKAWEPFGLPKAIVDGGKFYVPNRTVENRGAVFAMVPAGNGKYMPIKITPAVSNNLREGKLKEQLSDTFKQIASLDFATRMAAKERLYGTLVLDNDTNILVGSPDFNMVTIKRNGESTEFDLTKVSPEEVVKALESTPFRININQRTFLDNAKMKQYAEAGVFMTNAAILAGTGVNFSVYTCDENGKPMKENAPIGNESYVATPGEMQSVVWKGNIARLKDGKWVVEDIVKGRRIITSPAELRQLNYALQIQQQGLLPVLSKGGYEYYLVDSNPDNPIAVKQSQTGEIIVDSSEGAKEIARLAVEKQKELAKKEAEAENLEENSSIAEKGGGSMDALLGAEEASEEDQAPKGRTTEALLTTSEEASAKEVAESSETNEKDKKIHTKTLLDLHNPEKSITFAELFNDANHFEDIYMALADTFGESNLPSEAEVEKYEAFLKGHNLPVIVSSKEALIDLIKHCRQ